MKNVENKRKNNFFSALWKWSKDNRFFLLFLLFTAIIEMSTVWFLDGNPFMSRPFLSWGLLAFLGGVILLIPSRRAQVIIFSILLIVHFALQIVFSVIFDLTEQYFEYEMLNLKNDAFGTLENIPVRFGLFFVGITLCTVYVVMSLRGTRTRPRFKASKRSVFIKLGAAAVGVATIFTSFFCYYPRNINRYEEMINGTSKSSYSAYGVTGNLLGEFIGAIFPDKSTMPDEKIEEFIYAKEAEKSEYFGVSKDNNIITILGETLEWFSFLADDSKYINTLGLTDGEMAELFPNLRVFMNESVKMTNFHSREKTDIAETLSIMGSYPTTAYINYDYYENTMPLTIGNVLKTLDGDVQCRSFHNGFKTFYNRDDVHRAFGFESLTDMYDMARMAWEDYEAEKQANKDNPDWKGELAFQNYMKKGERNLDSEMIEVCKDEMFPTDKRFYTYITTITMHGIYYDRDNLDRWDQKLKEVVNRVSGRMPNPDDEDLKDDLLYHYLTGAMEFDYAIGKMMDELEERGLLDNTTIVVFGDHNAYYHSLSKYVKDIHDYETDKRYTDLYNVPMMIYDQKLTKKIQDNGGKDMVVDKFTCTADIASTILDLLGIRHYENMYYGTSVFNDKESVLYSRAYDTFIASGIVGRSVNNLLYQSPEVSDEELATYKTTAIALVEKIKHCDYIYKQNYFGNEKNYALYLKRIKDINAE